MEMFKIFIDLSGKAIRKTFSTENFMENMKVDYFRGKTWFEVENL
jgi:hypothetical protein